MEKAGDTVSYSTEQSWACRPIPVSPGIGLGSIPCQWCPGWTGHLRLHWQETQALTVFASPSPSSHPHPRHLWGWLYF